MMSIKYLYFHILKNNAKQSTYIGHGSIVLGILSVDNWEIIQINAEVRWINESFSFAKQ